MNEVNWMVLLTDNNQLQKVVETNVYTEKFGVRLSEEDAKQLLMERKETLQLEERIEFGEGVLFKLIFAFCDSPYIYQDNYVETVGRLQEIFYLYKNESLDELTDDELIDFMREAFNGICEGSLDYLEETSLEQLARKIRCNDK